MIVTLSVEPTPSAPELTLRPWRPDDVPALVAAHRDPLMRRWLATHLADEAAARRWVAAQEEGRADGSRYSFAMVADGRVVGHIAVKREGGAAAVGYWTAAEARGRGVASRALDAVSRWALRTLPLERIELFHGVGNDGSCRVAHKCGYALRSVLAPRPPAHPREGHLHVRERAGDTAVIRAAGSP